MEDAYNEDSGAIAVVGLNGRWPGANSPEALWALLRDGRDGIRLFEDGELEFDVRKTSMTDGSECVVNARSVLDDVDQFDASFFGIYPREAEVMDPQHRLFLECAWETLELTGYNPETYPGLVGVFGGQSLNTYLLYNLCRDRKTVEEFAGGYQVSNYRMLMGNDKDYLSTRVAYKLNLKGPAITMQTACSTSLVAINQACLNLEAYQCDMALAGGVSITFPQRRNYLYEKGAIASSDGTCRVFDENAAGTVFGSGIGIVALKRLEDALADGDQIRAVILGSATNNDGSCKVGYAAPSVQQQAEVIHMAQEIAGVAPDTISYIETHGTATPLGDPIEMEALTRAFRMGTDKKGFCAVGSAKPNVGHLEAAAGVTGLIKTILSMEHGELPRLLHFKKPNPRIDFENSPFYPVKEPISWKGREGEPLRAGVSSFGVGGTNAHVILEEGPAIQEGSPSRSAHSLVLSAKTETALKQMRINLAEALNASGELDLADISYTLHVGRKRFDQRLALTCRTREEAIEKLSHGDGRTVHVRKDSAEGAKVAFIFPGQGAQYPGMGMHLYEEEKVYRQAVDECAELLRPLMGEDIRDILFARGAYEGEVERINQTAVTQPCIFITEYALSRLWISWGVQPSAVVGHSIGEYVAAVLAGVFSLETALQLLAERARLIQSLPGGSMLAIRLSEADVRDNWLNAELSVAAVNSTAVTVVSGADAAVEALAGNLEAEEIYCKILATSHGFHSPMMDPILDEFTELAEKFTCQEPTIRWISTLTGKEVAAEDISDPSYWSRQIRHAVRFADALDVLLEYPELVVLEVGPGSSLSSMARQHPKHQMDQAVCTSLSKSVLPEEDYEALLLALGDVWSAGVDVDWESFYTGQRRLRVKLPTYPFERRRHWVEAPALAPSAVSVVQQPDSKEPAAETEVPLQETTAAPADPVSRLERLAEQLRDLIHGISGLDLESLGGDITFTEMGFDSLFLTQMSVSVQKRFRVNVAFRQLIDDLATINALASYLDAELPEEDPVAQKVIPAAAAPIAVPDHLSGDSSALARLMQQQMTLMQQFMSQSGGGAGDGGRSLVIRMPDRAEGLRDKKVHSRFGSYDKIETASDGLLTERQREALAPFFRRYIERTTGSKAYTAKHRGHFADPRAAAGFICEWKELVYPFVCRKSKGSRIWDIDGNEYIDITNGFGVTYFGHAADFVNEAVSEQLEKGYEIGPQAELAGKVSELFCEFVRMERATFCNTGTEAVMVAMRLARTVTGKDKVVYFGGGYHGTIDQVLVSGAWINGEYRSNPIAPGIPQDVADTMIVLDYGDPMSLEIIRTYADEIAAVLVEPIQSRKPGLQPISFMHELRDLTRECNIVYVMDEVVTGFRTHPGGIQARLGIEADLATYGKVVGGGMPIGILAGKRKYMDALDGGHWDFGDDSFPEVGVTFFAGTFVRHPLALAAAWAVLNYLKEHGEKLQLQLDQRVGRFVRCMNTFFVQAGAPIHLSTYSSWFMIEYPSELKLCSLLWYFLRDKGIHVWEGRPCHLTITHSADDFRTMVDSFVDAVDEMQKAGILPGSTEGVERPVYDENESSPLTEAEQEIFYSAVMGDDANCAYNEANLMRFNGELDHIALRSALQRLLDRHPALRSTISLDGSRQLFPETSELKLEEMDLRSQHKEEQDASVAAAMAAETAEPFDLHNGPLMRFKLLVLSDRESLLLLTAHHLVCDGWSWGMLIDELTRIYNAFKADQVCILPQPMAFSEYARVLNSAEMLDRRAASERYWIEKYSSGIAPLNLPTDRPRPAVKTFSAALVCREVDAALYEELKKRCPELGGTLFSTLLAAFSGLMHRITGQDDIAVGIPAAGQTSTGVDALVGHCLNMLPMRMEVAGSIPFNEYAERVKQEVLDAYEHQDYTFGSLIRKLDIPHDASRIPLVSVMFNVDRMGMDKLHMEGLEFEFVTNPKQFTNFELFFNLVQTDAELIIECEYNTDLFDRGTAQQFLDHYAAILHAVLEKPDIAISDIQLISSKEEAPVLPAPGRGPDLPLPEVAVHELISSTARKYPEKTAVVFEDTELTYAELEDQSTVLAASLLRRGVGSGKRVGIYCDRSLEMVVALMAVLKSGAAYVPMDPVYPPQRIQWMVEGADIEVVLTGPGYEDRVREFGAEPVMLGTYEPLDAALSVDAVSPDDLAYIIFTSGSTGRPKGVQISHRSFLNLMLSMQREPGICRDDILLAVTTLSFDMSVPELFLPLVAGGQVVIASKELSVDGGALVRTVEEKSITIMQATPVTWKLMVAAGWESSPNLTVLCGGEAFPRDLANALVSKSKAVWNMYGPTETTVYSLGGRVAAGDEVVSIGKPIANTTAYLVNDNLRMVPDGDEGELLVGGTGLAIGYLDNPEMTNSKFITLPETGERVYRTGDLARVMPDGRYECLGRIDHQIKLRGFRIEPGEIESALLSHDGVRDAVVVKHGDDDSTKRLVAYVVPEKEDPGADGWRAQWEMLFTHALDEAGADAEALTDIDSRIVSWAGGEAVASEVKEWIDTTMVRVRQFNLDRVLEIGCGTGQLLLRLAPDADEYWGSDFAAPAIDRLQALAGGDNIKLLHREASRFDGIPENYFDTVIINSVIQYFPGADYLADVIRQALTVLKPGGVLYIGDVQSNALLECFHTANQLKHMEGELTAGQLCERVGRRISRESELLVDPAFFLQFANELIHVDISLRRGEVINETTAYHYDVVFRKAVAPDPGTKVHWSEWVDDESLRKTVDEAAGDGVFRGVSGIPDARLGEDVALWKAVTEAPHTQPVARLKPQAVSGMLNPEHIWLLAESSGIQACIRWGNEPGTLDVVFGRQDVCGIEWPAVSFSGAVTNQPVQGSSLPVPAELKSHVSAMLPPYMVPSAVITIAELPLTANGKIDRNALPDPHADVFVQQADRDLVAPRSPTEDKLKILWSETLGLDNISVTDDFFDLGGDSILSFQITTKANAVGLQLTPRLFFKHKTIEAMARALDESETTDLDHKKLLQEITKGESDRTLFLIHAGEGGILFYQDFAEELKSVCSVYGIEAPWMRSEDMTAQSLEDVADTYLTLIREHQPHGPYMLGGFCYGGAVAFEIACRLKEQGEGVSQLILFDAPNPVYEPRRIGLLRRVNRNLELMRGRPVAEKLKVIASRAFGKIRAQNRVWRDRLKYGLGRLSDSAGGGKSIHVLMVHARLYHEKLYAQYVPRDYEGSMVLIEGMGRDPMYDYPELLGWSSVVRGTIVNHKVQAEHVTMLKYPSAIQVAELIAQEINKGSG